MGHRLRLWHNIEPAMGQSIWVTFEYHNNKIRRRTANLTFSCEPLYMGGGVILRIIYDRYIPPVTK